MLSFLHLYRKLSSDESRKEETAEGPFLPRASLRAGEKIRGAEIPHRTRAGTAGCCAAAHRDAGQDLVPEQTLQAQAPADRAAASLAQDVRKGLGEGHLLSRVYSTSAHSGQPAHSHVHCDPRTRDRVLPLPAHRCCRSSHCSCISEAQWSPCSLVFSLLSPLHHTADRSSAYLFRSHHCSGDLSVSDSPFLPSTEGTVC